MFDDLAPPGEDPHWEIFADLHLYMEKKFPLVYVPYSFQTISTLICILVKPRITYEDRGEQVCACLSLARVG